MNKPNCNTDVCKFDGKKCSYCGYDSELDKACIKIERYARSIGADCQIILYEDGVSVAPLEWSGDASGDTLYEALESAKRGFSPQEIITRNKKAPKK